MHQYLSKKERREIKRRERKAAKVDFIRSKSRKRAIIWSSVFLAVAAAVLGVVGIARYTPGGISASIISAITFEDWVRGGKESKISLIEYSDLQCPACANYHPLMEKINEEFGDKLQFAYRHFPLRSIHKNAEDAARAAESAGKQGKFWEMLGLIFENQKEWAEQKNAREIFARYAKSLELDAEKFKKDFDLEETVSKIEKDYQGGLRAGINATPTFFLNGKKIQNPRSYEDFRNIIQQNLNRNE